MKKISMIACSLIAIQLVGCGSDPVGETQAKINEIEATVKAAPIQDAPDVTAGQVFYMHAETRNPFVPESLYTLLQKPSRISAPVSNPNRKRSALEEYKVSDLYFIGLVKNDGKTLGLIETPQKSIFKVGLGAYVGNSNGRVSKITHEGIQVNEVRPNGVGGYYIYTQEVAEKPGVTQKVDQYGNVIPQNATNMYDNTESTQQFSAKTR